jgi:hypothetical protein
MRHIGPLTRAALIDVRDALAVGEITINMARLDNDEDRPVCIAGWMIRRHPEYQDEHEPTEGFGVLIMPPGYRTEYFSAEQVITAIDRFLSGRPASELWS